MSDSIINQQVKGKEEKYESILLKAIILVSIFSAGFFIGFKLNEVRIQNSVIDSIKSSIQNSEPSQSASMNVYYEVLKQIETGYLSKEIDEMNLVYGSVRGMVSALDDKYTTFLDPEETKEVSNLNGSVFEGIGTTLRYEGEYTVIETPIDGFPAQKAGLMPKDIILEVNEEDMRRKQAHYVAEKIMGEAGTNVKLKIFRESDQKVYEKDITRAVIDMDNIEYEHLGNGIYKIEIHKFTESSVLEFKQKWNLIIDEVNKDGARGIVLDLRSNPGGFVDAATYVLEEFLPKNSLILSEVDRNDNKVEKRTTREGRMVDVPLVVLVNSGSASASEIVAGALQDYDRAKLVGEETVGKGVEQRVINLKDGSSLHLVYKKWLTPDGHNVTYDNSIQPDEYIEYTTEDFEASRDPQFDKAIEILNSEIN